MPLEAVNLSFAYRPGRPVLRDVCLALEPGTITGLIGPNGAGKSTLLRLLLGLLAPGGGEVKLDGKPVVAMEHRERALRLAYVSQRSTLAFSFSVRRSVTLGRFAARGSDGAAVDAALAAVDLTDRADEPFGTLSVGQQQRAALARAIAQLDLSRPPSGTRALVLDEPVSALDPRHVLQSMALLRDLADRGLAVVLALHDLGLAFRACDRAAVVDGHGRVAAAGPVATALSPGVLEPVFGVRFGPGLTPSAPLMR